MIEVDRVLRPGGYWILSGPPINWKTHWQSWQRTQEDLKAEQDSIEDLARRLCWHKVAEKNNIAIWQKPLNHKLCAIHHSGDLLPRICKGENADLAWSLSLSLSLSTQLLFSYVVLLDLHILGDCCFGIIYMLLSHFIS